MAFEKYKPRGSFSEFYSIFFLVGILDHPQIFLSPQHLKKTLH